MFVFLTMDCRTVIHFQKDQIEKLKEMVLSAGGSKALFMKVGEVSGNTRIEKWIFFHFNSISKMPYPLFSDTFCPHSLTGQNVSEIKG